MSIIAALKGLLRFGIGEQSDGGYITLVYRPNGEVIVVHDSLSVAKRTMQGSVLDTELSTVFENGISSWGDPEYDSDLEYDMDSSSSVTGVDLEEVCPPPIGDCSSEVFESTTLVNPCSGLPMLDDVIDVAGNPWGICNDINDIESDSMFDEPF